MKRKTTQKLMVAFILFIVVAAIVKIVNPEACQESTWKRFITATVATSFFLVLSDYFAAMADSSQEHISTVKPKLESYLLSLRQYKKNNKHLNEKVINENGDETNKTIRQLLRKTEKQVLVWLRVLKLEEILNGNAIDIAASFELIGFFLFFSVILFESLFVFLNNLSDEMSMLALGFVLATRCFINMLTESVLDISQSLDDINNDMDVLNRCCKMEEENHAD